MKRFITLGCSLALLGACSGTPVVQGATGTPGNALTSTPEKAATASASAAAPDGKPVATTGEAAPAAVTYREVTLPAGTVLPVDLETAVGSDTSRVEQPVSGRLRHAVTVNGVQALPAGTIVNGHVTAAQRPGKVKGRGMIAMRFTQLDPPGEGRTAISTATVSRIAPATKQKDALQIGAPAAAGAIIGGIVGGKGGAGKGALIGGAGGTGYVLATRGKDVRLAPGADLSVKLTAPVTVRVRQ